MTTPTRDQVARQIEELVRAGDTKALKALRDQLRSRVDRRNLRERTRLYAHNPTGWVEERLRQVVWSKQREIMLSVTDEGKGIPEADLDRVFEKFYRRAKGDGRPAGTGLGLAIARGLITAMGGTIKAESPAIRRRGTRFVVRLPRAGEAK